MLIYILKSSTCLAMLLLFYKLFLEKENMHVFKRFYLIGMVIIAFGIPLITFTQYAEASVEIQPLIIDDLSVATNSQNVPASTILWNVYGLGVLIFGILFLKNLIQILFKIRQNTKVKSNHITKVLLDSFVIPHTFFSFIFLNKHKFETGQIPKEVILHEESHALQKHSLDILFIEVLQVILWFNPLIYILKNNIKLNHEFLADQAVLNKDIDTTRYQNLLLAFSSNTFQPQLANAINYSLIKKRFTVMKTQTTKKAVWLRRIFLLPLLTIVLFSFSNKEIIQKDSIDLSESAFTTLKEKATPKMIVEYNALAKKYNSKLEDIGKIKRKELQRLEYIYHLMSDAQKKNAEPFPNISPPPPPIVPDAPNPPNVSAVIEIEEFPKAPNPGNIEVPPAPPPPKSPLEHVKEMAEKDAKFYFDDKPISSAKAIELISLKKHISVLTNHTDDSDYKVHLTSKPIVVAPNE